MELKRAKEMFGELWKKDRVVKAVFLLGICGVALLFLSSWLDGGGEEPRESPTQEESFSGYRQQLEADLARIVTAITGEDAPAVMVTLEDTGERVYATDRTASAETSGEGGDAAPGSREEQTTHILLKDGDGAQRALPVTEIQPEVKGVVIVSRRAGDPVIREKLTQAVRTALDVSSARVCVTGSG